MCICVRWQLWVYQMSMNIIYIILARLVSNETVKYLIQGKICKKKDSAMFSQRQKNDEN